MSNVVINFSGIYENQQFIEKAGLPVLDFSDISGTDCYCDDNAYDLIKERMDNLKLEGLHFVDSGNYHYMSKIWLEKLDTDCTLVVFDHHPDMQPPLFGDILSCGSWVWDLIKENTHIKKIYVIGSNKDLLDNLPDEVEDFVSSCKVIFYCKQDANNWGKLALKNENVYISVDKDVLSDEELKTNWDQGNMKMQGLIAMIDEIFLCNKVIGMDVCGEPAKRDATDVDIELSNEINHIFCDKYLKMF